jgi:hypothetical protein
MLGSKLRPSSRLLGRSLRRRQRVLPNGASRCISTEREKHLQEVGYLDEKGLTAFDTLHEMQLRSCAVFAENDLFGTYDPESEKFVYETFQDYANQVDRCRAVLKDLGE